MDLGVYLSAQIVPDGFRHGEKRFDDVGIELSSGKSRDLFEGGACGLRGAIRAVRGDGVQRVSDGEYSCAERDLLAFEIARIAGAVVLLLMRVDDVGGFSEERNLA